MTVRLRPLFFAGALAAACVAAPSAVAATWGSTQSPIPPGANGGAARLSLNASGRGLVDWTVDGPKGASRSGLATIDGGGVVGLSTVTKGYRVAGDPTVDRSGRGLVLTGTGPTAYEVNRLHWATVSKSGRIGRRTLLSTGPLQGEPVLAANDRGDAIAAWTQLIPSGARVIAIRVALRPAGGEFGKPQTLLADLSGGEPPAAAIDSTGHVVVAYGQGEGNRVVAWSGTIRGGFGPARTVGPHVGRVNVAAALAAGRAIVAWGTQRGGEEAASPYVVRAATQRASGTFRPSQVVDPGGPKLFPAGRVRLVPRSSGSAVLAWNTVYDDAQGTPVRTALLGASGKVGKVQSITGTAGLGGLAVQPGGGDVALVWAGADAAGTGVLAAFLPADSQLFGLPELAGPLQARPATTVTPLTADPPVPAYSGDNTLRVALAYPSPAGGKQDGQLTVLTRTIGP